MPDIPQKINGVKVDFANAVDRNVEKKLVRALKTVIKPHVTEQHRLKRIYISSADDQHQFPSRHVQGQGKAVDISRINGKKMSLHYGSDPSVTAIVNALQTEFEKFKPLRRENFGPSFDKKLGQKHPVPGHKNHIHFSVN